jgi:endonuclease G
VTNWQVFKTLESAQDPRVRVLFGYEENEDGQIPSSVTLGVDPDRFFVTGDKVLDFALVAIKALRNGKPPGTRFGSIGMNPAFGKAVLGQPVNIIQHPAGTARKLAFRQNVVLNVDDLTQLIYRTDTMRGSSGSPVFNDDWQLVAVHHSAEQATDSCGRRIDINGNPVTSETPDYLRNWVANAGIRVSRIVDHLDTLALVGERAELLAAVLRPE